MPSLKCNKERQGNSLKKPGVTFVQKPQIVSLVSNSSLNAISKITLVIQEILIFETFPSGYFQATAFIANNYASYK